MEAYLKSLGYGVWLAVKNGYIPPTTDIVVESEMKKLENDAKALNARHNSLSTNEFARVVGCATSKEIWDKLQSIHESDERIKEAKLQHYRAQFESLKMTEEETIGIGEQITDAVVVKKILRSAPEVYNAKVSAIEESRNLNQLSLNDLQANLTAYEMRMVKPKTTRSGSDDSNDELTAYLAKRLKKGHGKYKAKLPLKCFNCGGIGHFASKCPKKGKINLTDDEEESEPKKGKKKYVSSKKNYFKKKSLMTKKDNNTSEEESDEEESEDERYETLFMTYGSNTSHKSYEKSDEEEEFEGQCDREVELFHALT
ncbi:uncharacterized protein LOC122645049 [Telopea speciosissima]|uniref:uncharacterized protein LOC122645049 n=1 Tax=Telopea speciosissima TaxID=54955 RepID=UPI001CC6AA0A|nr:uncharacterized protein LOC122645049 [Telopea speciosissima]